ncbi:MAG TPA: hypothetical protein VMW48_12190 [Vicinamibacterales bacterium]|nr:hypothetical protein [Vicinamibacterales bacterium]
MAITIAEAYDSRPLQRGTQPSHTRRYRIKGSSDEAAVADALAAYAPSTSNGLSRQNYGVEPVHVDTENEALCRWLGLVYYGSSQYDRPATGDSRFSFDTTGGTQHITQSIATVASYAASGQPAAPDFKGAINVGQGGTVQGCDIVVPVFKWDETHYVDDDDVTDAYKADLADLTGKVNDDAFQGLAGASYAAGEVLFLGAQGAGRDDEDWEINFHFARSPNLTGISAGDISGIAKGGWQYLWFRYKSPAGSDDIARPVAAYVEQVYHDGDFADLGL